MYQKTQIELWDFFAYVMVGTTVLLFEILHAALWGIASLTQLAETPDWALAIVLTLLLLLLGLLWEPVANFISKISRCIAKGDFHALDLRNWDNQIEGWKQDVSGVLPQVSDPFQFCKNWVIKYGNSSQYSAFLAKFGFYRSISTLFLLNAAIILGEWWFGLVSPPSFLPFLLVALGCLYYYRSCVYYRHVAVAVYQQFLVRQAALAAPANDLRSESEATGDARQLVGLAPAVGRDEQASERENE